MARQGVALEFLPTFQWGCHDASKCTNSKLPLKLPRNMGSDPSPKKNIQIQTPRKFSAFTTQADWTELLLSVQGPGFGGTFVATRNRTPRTQVVIIFLVTPCGTMNIFNNSSSFESREFRRSVAGHGWKANAGTELRMVGPLVREWIGLTSADKKREPRESRRAV